MLLPVWDHRVIRVVAGFRNGAGSSNCGRIFCDGCRRTQLYRTSRPGSAALHQSSQNGFGPAAGCCGLLRKQVHNKASLLSDSKHAGRGKPLAVSPHLSPSLPLLSAAYQGGPGAAGGPQRASHESAGVLFLAPAKGPFARSAPLCATPHLPPAACGLRPGHAVGCGASRKAQAAASSQPNPLRHRSRARAVLLAFAPALASGGTGRSPRAATCRSVCFGRHWGLADARSAAAFRSVSRAQDVLRVICSVLPALFELRLGTPFAFQAEG